MGRESRNNPTAQQSNAGKLMSRQTFLGKVDHALERHALEIMLAHKRIEAMEARVVALESALLNERQEKSARVPFDIKNMTTDPAYPTGHTSVSPTR